MDPVYLIFQFNSKTGGVEGILSFSVDSGNESSFTPVTGEKFFLLVFIGSRHDQFHQKYLNERYQFCKISKWFNFYWTIVVVKFSIYFLLKTSFCQYVGLLSRLKSRISKSKKKRYNLKRTKKLILWCFRGLSRFFDKQLFNSNALKWLFIWSRGYWTKKMTFLLDSSREP